MEMSTLLFLGDIGGSELMLIMVVILIFFGANKIPELARGLGKGIREFKDASREIRSEIENAPITNQNRPSDYHQPTYQQPAAPQTPPAPVAYQHTGLDQPEAPTADAYSTPEQPTVTPAGLPATPTHQHPTT